jgi:hypothetical protein
MWAEKRPHEWRGGVLGVLRLALSAHISQIYQKVIKGYIAFFKLIVITNLDELLIYYNHFQI